MLGMQQVAMRSARGECLENTHQYPSTILIYNNIVTFSWSSLVDALTT